MPRHCASGLTPAAAGTRGVSQRPASARSENHEVPGRPAVGGNPSRAGPTSMLASALPDARALTDVQHGGLPDGRHCHHSRHQAGGLAFPVAHCAVPDMAAPDRPSASKVLSRTPAARAHDQATGAEQEESHAVDGRGAPSLDASRPRRRMSMSHLGDVQGAGPVAGKQTNESAAVDAVLGHRAAQSGSDAGAASTWRPTKRVVRPAEVVGSMAPRSHADLAGTGTHPTRRQSSPRALVSPVLARGSPRLARSGGGADAADQARPCAGSGGRTSRHTLPPRRIAGPRWFGESGGG